MRTDLLLMRFILLNAGGATLFFLAYKLGMVKEAWDADPTWITESIYALSGVGFILTAWRIWQCVLMLNGRHQRVLDFYRTKDREVLRVKLDSRLTPIEYIGYTLVTLGFLGTVWGFKVALASVDPTQLTSASAVAPMIGGLIEGMSVAIMTTITGIVGYIWIGFNVRLLESGHKRLYTKLLEEAYDTS